MATMASGSAQVTRETLTELALFEGLIRRMPDDIDVLKSLADLYTRVGRYEDGLALDRTLAQLCPDDQLIWYNLGCSWALVRRQTEAIDALAHAIELGYRDWQWMQKDEDLRTLRNDSRFASLLKQLVAK